MVERIEPGGAFLMVEHKPLIKLFPRKNGCLPIKIAGVNLSGNAISWLQSIVAGNRVLFIPVIKRKDCIISEVFLPQPLNNVSIFICGLKIFKKN